jgi:hypothetical protein
MVPVFRVTRRVSPTSSDLVGDSCDLGGRFALRQLLVYFESCGLPDTPRLDEGVGVLGAHRLDSVGDGFGARAAELCADGDVWNDADRVEGDPECCCELCCPFPVPDAEPESGKPP